MTEESFEEPQDQPVDEIADEAADEFGDEPEAPFEEPDAEASPDASPAVATGHPAVDEVLRSLGALSDAPVDEHVAVFEEAHEQLRRTLSGAGDDQQD